MFPFAMSGKMNANHYLAKPKKSGVKPYIVAMKQSPNSSPLLSVRIMNNKTPPHNLIAKNLYTPLSEARELVLKRFADEKLKNKVLSFYGANVPPFHINKPRAVISRPIATPNFEFEYFLDVARETGLDTLILEYPDKFVTKNSLKYHLCRIKILDRSKNHPNNVTKHSPVNFNEWEGKHLSQVKTTSSKYIISQHHELLLMVHPELQDKIYDFTSWFETTRGTKNEDYYIAFLSLFVCFGILFENYLVDDKREQEFVVKKVIPAFEKVTELFGVKPIICPILPLRHEKDEEWYWYDHKHLPIIKNLFI